MFGGSAHLSVSYQIIAERNLARTFNYTFKITPFNHTVCLLLGYQLLEYSKFVSSCTLHWADII